MDSFTQLDVWNKAHTLVLEIYRVTQDFPSTERFRLTDQLCRSAISIPANIAEGTGRNTLKEYAQLLHTVHDSLEETKCHILLVKDLRYMSDAEYEALKARSDEVERMLNGLIRSLKSDGRKQDE